MQSHERDLLNNNIEPLARAIKNFADISQLLLAKETFNQSMIDHIQEYASDPHFRNIVLISDLQTRGPSAFRDFIEVLEVAGYFEALKILSPVNLIRQKSSKVQQQTVDLNEVRRVHEQKKYPLGLFSYNFTTNESHPPYATSNDKREGGRLDEMDDTSSKVPSISLFHNVADEENVNSNNQQNVQPKQQIQQRVEKLFLEWHPYTTLAPMSASTSTKAHQGSKTSQKETIHSFSGESTSNQGTSELLNHYSVTKSSNYKDSSRMTTSSRRAPNAMNVRMAVLCQDNPIENYKMTSRIRGLCIIINNMDFEGDILSQRNGSDIDAYRFQSIFQQLWFKVHLEQNLSSDMIMRTLKNLAMMCEKDHDALIVIILSHGSDSGVYGTDGIEIDSYEILSCFDNESCRAMKNKPKVFIFQACRGTLSDYGEKSDEEDPQDEADDNMIHAILDKEPQFRRCTEFSSSGSLVKTDMLVCYSCLPGYVSVRNEVAGSWLGTALSYYLMTCAWEKDLDQILAMVSEDFKSKVSSHGHKQAMEIRYLGWTKKLFFNPGIYK